MWPKIIYVPIALLYDTYKQRPRANALTVLDELGNRNSKLVFFVHCLDHLCYITREQQENIETHYPHINIYRWPMNLSRCREPDKCMLIDYDTERIASMRAHGIYAYVIAKSSKTAFSRTMWCDSVIAYIFFHGGAGFTAQNSGDSSRRLH